MIDKTPLELGNAILYAQQSIHTIPPGWALSAGLAEFCDIMQKWAQHPVGRNWKLISDIEDFISSIESRNQQKGG